MKIPPPHSPDPLAGTMFEHHEAIKREALTMSLLPMEVLRRAAAEDARAERGRRIRAPRPPRDYAAEAEEWAAANPRQWRTASVMARRWARTRSWVSMKAIFEFLRGYVPLRKVREPYLLDNGLTAPRARRWARENPDLADRIEFRRSRSGPVPYQDARPCPGARRADAV